MTDQVLIMCKHACPHTLELDLVAKFEGVAAGVALASVSDPVEGSC